jgi:hypothetical protein
LRREKKNDVNKRVVDNQEQDLESNKTQSNHYNKEQHMSATKYARHLELENVVNCELPGQLLQGNKVSGDRARPLLGQLAHAPADGARNVPQAAAQSLQAPGTEGVSTGERLGDDLLAGVRLETNRASDEGARRKQGWAKKVVKI